jgi:hypothetical protein
MAVKMMMMVSFTILGFAQVNPPTWRAKDVGE